MPPSDTLALGIIILLSNHKHQSNAFIFNYKARSSYCTDKMIHQSVVDMLSNLYSTIDEIENDETLGLMAVDGLMG